MKRILIFLSLILGVFVPQQISAQASWERCADGAAIARCETYDCPQGDTNGDGECNLSDTKAKLTDARNDSFCANPLSGCGQVQYYKVGSSDSCAIRVKENKNNCDLYAVSDVNFSPLPPSNSDNNSNGGDLECVGLTASPFEGRAPMRVNFLTETSGPDEDLAFEFSFGDGSQIVRQSLPGVSHQYTKTGVFTAVVRARSGDGAYVTGAACIKTITVRDGVENDDNDSDTLPATGPEMWIGLFLVMVGAGAYYINAKTRSNI